MPTTNRDAAPTTTPADSVIRIRNLTKRYGATAAVDDVSFDVHPGRITAFIGPNGAGKTTLMKMMAGLVTPTGGDVTYQGTSLLKSRIAADAISFAIDPTAFHPGRSVIETLRTACVYIGEPFATADSICETVGLASVRTRAVRQLSLGMRQRLSLAHALLPNPTVLVLDEPFNGLDVDSVLWVEQFLQQRREAGGATLLSTHLLRQIEGLADDAVIISQGQIVSSGPTQANVGEVRSVATCSDAAALHQAATAAGLASAMADPATVIVDCSPEELFGLAVRSQVVLSSLAQHTTSLEEQFRAHTVGEFRPPS